MVELTWATGQVDGLSADLHARINRFNEDATGLRDGRSLDIEARSADGELAAGLTGWTWGGCGYVDVLWVREDCRRSGVGSRLLEAAEREARGRGCTVMALSTHSFQAPDFYRQRGYVVCGTTEGYPTGYSHLHLSKPLTPHGSSRSSGPTGG
jgi:GNAT superfamily N-acetyltransferase